MSTTNPITCQCNEPCSNHTDCAKAGLCLGSDEGVAYQEGLMKAFFEWLLPQYEELDWK
jgi:hypothetical protein